MQAQPLPGTDVRRVWPPIRPLHYLVVDLVETDDDDDEADEDGFRPAAVAGFVSFDEALADARERSWLSDNVAVLDNWTGDWVGDPPWWDHVWKMPAEGRARYDLRPTSV